MTQPRHLRNVARDGASRLPPCCCRCPRSVRRVRPVCAALSAGSNRVTADRTAYRRASVHRVSKVHRTLPRLRTLNGRSRFIDHVVGPCALKIAIFSSLAADRPGSSPRAKRRVQIARFRSSCSNATTPWAHRFVVARASGPPVSRSFSIRVRPPVSHRGSRGASAESFLGAPTDGRGAFPKVTLVKSSIARRSNPHSPLRP